MKLIASAVQVYKSCPKNLVKHEKSEETARELCDGGRLRKRRKF